MTKGIFITFESVGEGLGKTTQTKHLYDRLSNMDMNVMSVREPGGTVVGEQVRSLLKDAVYEKSIATEVLLFQACRSQLYHEVLKPSLENGKVILSDRFFDSTLCYQGFGRGVDLNVLHTLHNYATENLIPDLTIVLNGTPHREMDQSDSFEKSGDEFFERVRFGMLELANGNPRYVIINANRDEYEIAEEIFHIVYKRFWG